MLYDDRDKMFGDSTIEEIEQAAEDAGFYDGDVTVASCSWQYTPAYVLAVQDSHGSETSSCVRRGEMAALDDAVGGVSYVVSTTKEAVDDGIEHLLGEGCATLFFFDEE